MSNFLKQSTASQSRAIGPFLDDTDFKTAETGLTIANTDIKLIVNGGASADKNSGGGTHRANGMYGITFDATDTATVGELEVSVKVAGALPVFKTFFVLEEAVYDALFAASAPGYVANAPVNVAQFGGTNGTFSGGRPEVNTSHAAGTAWNSGAIGAATLASDTITAAKVATGAITSAKFAAGAIDAAAVADGAIDAATFAANAITSTVIADNAITANKVATGAITAAKFAAGAIDAAAIADGAIDAATFAANAINTTAIATGALTAAKFAAGAIDAAALATDAANEIRDAVWAKTFTELTGDPTATPTAADASMLAYMAIRNRRDTTATNDEIHNSAGSVILTAAVSDDGTTFTKAKYA